MVTLKTKEEITKLRSGGKILAQVLRDLEKYTKENYQNPDFNTSSINKKCEELLQQNKVTASFKNYSNHGLVPYPASICVSVNDEVVHGIPGNRVLKDGDLVSLDLGVIYEKLYTDAAISFILGKNIQAEDEFLVKTTKESLLKGIEQARIGNTIGDIGNAIESYVKDNGFKVIHDYCGHGVGYSVHEEPLIPNYGRAGDGLVLAEGMILAIEPMVVLGSSEVYVDKNSWTVKTADTKRSAHFEHTVAITIDGPLILTE